VRQIAEEKAAILVVTEDYVAIVAPHDDMQGRAGKEEAGHPGHARMVAAADCERYRPKVRGIEPDPI
jgi:glycyl-tRNA synthetase beta subunit